jgi:hypothetical protein
MRVPGASAASDGRRGRPGGGTATIAMPPTITHWPVPPRCVTPSAASPAPTHATRAASTPGGMRGVARQGVPVVRVALDLGQFHLRQAGRARDQGRQPTSDPSAGRRPSRCWSSATRYDPATPIHGASGSPLVHQLPPAAYEWGHGALEQLVCDGGVRPTTTSGDTLPAGSVPRRRASLPCSDGADFARTRRYARPDRPFAAASTATRMSAARHPGERDARPLAFGAQWYRPPRRRMPLTTACVRRKVPPVGWRLLFALGVAVPCLRAQLCSGRFAPRRPVRPRVPRRRRRAARARSRRRA